MQFQSQSIFEKTVDLVAPSYQLTFVFRQQNEVVYIAQVISGFERVFDEMVQLIEVDIGEKLAG